MRALSLFTRQQLPRRLSVVCLLLTATLWTGNAAAAGAGDINVSPKRIVFDVAGHGATVYLFNRGDGPATYSIAVIDRVMIPDGQIISVDDAKRDPYEAAYAAKLTSARDFIQFTPRRVTLKPNESQTIRLRALKPDALAPVPHPPDDHSRSARRCRSDGGRCGHAGR